MRSGRFIDADACPFKAEVAKVAERHGLTITYVANAWMQTPPRGSRFRMLVVTATFDVPNSRRKSARVIAGRRLECDAVCAASWALCSDNADAGVREQNGWIMPALSDAAMSHASSEQTLN
jgi:hypothetical protein